MTTLPITSLYAAALGLLLIPFTIRVGLRRVHTRIFAGHGDDEVLHRRVRAHANFLEYVPLAVILIALTEFRGAPAILVHTLGALLVVSRTVHYITLTMSPLAITRALSMLGTIAVFLLSSSWLLYGLAFQ
jgi:uncharacterized protein